MTTKIARLLQRALSNITGVSGDFFKGHVQRNREQYQ
jgi:hypothetical protein